MPESKKEDTVERQHEDRDFLMNILENKMNLDVGVIQISKLVRLGRREAGQNKTYSVYCRCV